MASLITILPGEFLVRSLLGWTDYHIVGGFSTALAMLFLILGLTPAFGKQNWAIVKKPLLYALFSGIILGLYILSWVGARLLAFILFFYSSLVCSLVNRLR